MVSKIGYVPLNVHLTVVFPEPVAPVTLELPSDNHLGTSAIAVKNAYSIYTAGLEGFLGAFPFCGCRSSWDIDDFTFPAVVPVWASFLGLGGIVR